MLIVAAVAPIAKATFVRRAVKVLLAVVPLALTAAVVGALFLSMLVTGVITPTVTAPVANGCAPVVAAGQVKTTLDATQLANVATIVAVGRQMSVPEHGWVVAVATAMQESTLLALPYGDRDSLGLFQQRPRWGTAEQRLDPATATRMFFSGGREGQKGLLDIPGWQLMPVTVAGQAVQNSGFPGAYAQWQSLAQSVVGIPAVAAATCTGSAGFPVEAGLQPSTVAGRNMIDTAFPGLEIGCLRQGADAQDHALGLACDFMAGGAKGQAIADFVQANSAVLQITYVIFNRRIFNVDRADEGWRLMPDRGSPTANHVDHPHVSFRPKGKR